jgi:hypothetical protein
MISWLLPTLIIIIIVVGIGGFALSCCVVSARAERKAADGRELREVDEWLEAMWRA